MSPIRALLAAALALLVAAPAAPAAPTRAGGWPWPVEGRVLTPFELRGEYQRGGHRGIDIAAPEGTAVRSPVAGEVRFAGRVASAGLVVTVRSADGRYDVTHVHLAGVAVRAGERVGRGDVVGIVGTSGRPSVAQPHLHLGVRLVGPRRRYVDPLSLLARPAGPVAQPLAPPAPLRPVTRRGRSARPVGAAPGGRPPARPAPVRPSARPGRPAGLAPGARPPAPASAAGPVPVRRGPVPSVRGPELGPAPSGGAARVRDVGSPVAPPGGSIRVEAPLAQPGPPFGRIAALAGLLAAALALGGRRSPGSPRVPSPRPLEGAARPGRRAAVASARDVLLRHDAHLLRQRGAAPRPRVHHHRRRRPRAPHASAR